MPLVASMLRLCCCLNVSVVQMGLVSQECLLFQGSIEDNIRYGTETATSEQVVQAAKAAYAHEFIMAMPQVCVEKKKQECHGLCVQV